jgi:hypothetical protein
MNFFWFHWIFLKVCYNIKQTITNIVFKISDLSQTKLIQFHIYIRNICLLPILNHILILVLKCYFFFDLFFEYANNCRSCFKIFHFQEKIISLQCFWTITNHWTLIWLLNFNYFQEKILIQLWYLKLQILLQYHNNVMILYF